MGGMIWGDGGFYPSASARYCSYSFYLRTLRDMESWAYMYVCMYVLKYKYIDVN
jgi:hypothetical protein